MKIFVRHRFIFDLLLQLLLLAVSYRPLISGTSYGSDTAVSIVNPFNITDQDNIIKTFAATKNGFAFVDATTTCSFQSIFPVAGPINLRGGKLYLQSDLILTNTGTFADLGTIIGQNHSVVLSESNDTFANNTTSTNTLVFPLVARVTALRPIFSLDWSYDNQYLAVVTTSGPGNELHIYSFNGTTLTLLTGINLGSNGTSVRWRPNSYYLAVATPGTANEIRIYLFNGISTLTLKNTQNPVGTLNSVAWQGRGDYLAAAGSVVYVYHFNAGTETLDVQYTPTNNAALNGTISYDNLHWAPIGNTNDFIAGTSGGSLHLYNFTGSAVSHLKRYDLGTAIRSLDWAPTSTYVALGFTGGNIKTYQHTASLNTIIFKNTAIIASSVNTVSWKPDATQLTAGCNTFAGNEHQFFSFDTTSYALTNIYNIEVGNNVNAVKFSNDNGMYNARADNSTQFLSVFKESSTSFIFQDLHLFLNGNLTLNSPITFMGDCSINGRGSQLTFTGNGAINIAQNSLLEVANSNLKFEQPYAFALQGKTSQLSLQNSQITLDNDIVFGDGSWKVYDDVTITGPHILAYSSANTSTIHANSNLIFNNGATFEIGRVTALGSSPLLFENDSAHLVLDNATLHITNSGLRITKGVLDVYNESIINVDYTDTYLSITAQALQFGDGIIKANDATIILHGSGTKLDLINGGIIFDNCVTQTLVQFYGQPQLAVETTTSLYFKRPIKFENGWFRPRLGFMFVIDPGSYWTFDNTRISYDEVASDYVLTATIARKGYFLLDDNGRITLNTGIVYNNLLIDGKNILFTGNGQLPGIISFMSNTTSLTWDLLSHSINNIELNGQEIIFTENSGLDNGYSFIGTGTINLLETTFMLNTQENTWHGNLCWVGNGSTITLRNNFSLDGTWTLSGIQTIDGNAFTFDLGNTGSIIIERGAHVTFRNLTLQDVSRHNGIVCCDNTSKITLDNVKITQNGDYLFNKGSILFSNNVNLDSQGTTDRVYSFSYASNQTSTIFDASTLHIQGIKFAIGRNDATITTPSRQPLIFAERDSVIDLCGGTLHITSSGMTVTKGTILVSSYSNIETETPKFEYGLVFGDGINNNNDAILEINGGQQLNILSGKIYYNNYAKEDRFIFDSQSSCITIMAYQGFVTRRPMLIKNGILRHPGLLDNINEEAGGKFGQLNMLSQHTADKSEHRVSTSSLYPAYFLDGEYLQSLVGYTSVPLFFVQGTGSLSGSGGSNSPVTISNHTVLLNLGLGAGMRNSIILNGGTIKLVQDTNLFDDGTITGSGTINLDIYNLGLGIKDSIITNTLLIQASKGRIELNSPLDLYGTWTLQGTLELHGRGNILNLSTCGKIIVQPHTNVYLTNIVLKGIGTTTNNIELTDPTSHLILSRVYLELDNNYTFTAGGIIVNGPTTIGLANYNLLLDNAASMTINGVTLWQDPLDTINHGKITFGSGPLINYLSLVSNGTIKTASNLDSEQSAENLATQLNTIDHGPSNIDIASSSHQLAFDVFLSSDHMMNIPDNTVINGNGHTMHIASNASGVITIAAGKTATFHNVIFRNYTDTIFALGAGAQVIFGDGVYLELTQNQALERQWTFTGNSGIYGNGYELALDPYAIEVLPHSALTMHSVALTGLKGTNLHGDDATSSIILSQVTMYLDHTFSITTGGLVFDPDVVIVGTNTFTYASDATSSIARDSQLYLSGITFNYAPSVANRDLFAMIDQSSRLFIDGCTLSSTTTGMRLTRGTLIADHKNFLDNAGATSISEGFAFGDGNPEHDLSIEVKPGGSLNLIAGQWDYHNTNV
ncbi:MAG: WD40 repeat domain-containing protein [Candidatus Babeliales bacterium]|jgi:hypothetical protein